MKLPNGQRAVIDLAKLRDYCLNPLHPTGKHKARLFSSVLGLTDSHALLLSQALLKAAVEEAATLHRVDAFGVRYTVDFSMTRAGRTAIVRSGWIVLHGEDFPRVTTSFILKA